MSCAVCGCNNNSNSNYKAKKEKISYFRFPTDPDLLEKWVQFCKRQKGFNIKKARICSDHFTPEDFENNMQFEKGVTNRPKLKPGSVPSIEFKSDSSTSKSKSRESTENSSLSEDPVTSIKNAIQGTLDSASCNTSIPSTSDHRADAMAIGLERRNSITNASTSLIQGQMPETNQSSCSSTIVNTESKRRPSTSDDLTTSIAVEEQDTTRWSDFTTFDPSFRIKLDTKLRKKKGGAPKKVNFNIESSTTSIESQDNCAILPLVDSQLEITESNVHSSGDERKNPATINPTTCPDSLDISTTPVLLVSAETEPTIGDVKGIDSSKEGITSDATTSNVIQEQSSGDSNSSETPVDINRDAYVRRVKRRKSRNINSMPIDATTNQAIDNSIASMPSVDIGISNEPATSTAAQEQDPASLSDSSTSESSFDTKQDTVVKKVKRRKIKKDKIKVLIDPTTSTIAQDYETDSSSGWISASSSNSVSSIEIKANAAKSRPQATQVKDDNNPSTSAKDQDKSKSTDSSTNSVPSVETETEDDKKRVKKRRVKKVNRLSAAEGKESSASSSSEDTCVPPETRKRSEKSRKVTKCVISKSDIVEMKTSIAKIDEQNVELKKMQEKLQENIKTLQRQLKQNPLFARPRKLKKRAT